MKFFKSEIFIRQETMGKKQLARKQRARGKWQRNKEQEAIGKNMRPESWAMGRRIFVMYIRNVTRTKVKAE